MQMKEPYLIYLRVSRIPSTEPDTFEVSMFFELNYIARLAWELRC